MQIENITVVACTFQFIIPGYIISQIISSISPQKQYSESEMCIRALGYSLFNAAIWIWLFRLFWKYITPDSNWYWVVNAIGNIITGFLTGIILGLVQKNELLRKILSLCHIEITVPIPTAWDYKFNDKKPYWVEISVDGGVLRGLYAGKSLSSTDHSFRDIYLEKLYHIHDGVWVETEQTGGVWVNPTEIRYIKFYEMEENYSVKRSEEQVTEQRLSARL